METHTLTVLPWSLTAAPQGPLIVGVRIRHMGSAVLMASEATPRMLPQASSRMRQPGEAMPVSESLMGVLPTRTQPFWRTVRAIVRPTWLRVPSGPAHLQEGGRGGQEG